MPTACIIGAGVSGIAAARALRDRGVQVQVYEKGSSPGGLWRYQNDNGLSGIYESLQLNTSKALTEFPDFPMPADYPDYPDHRQFLRYLESVIDRFELGALIRTRAPVERVLAQGDRWLVTLEDGSSASFDAVLIASGHHWKPRRPSFPGRFAGTILHSHEYRTPDTFRGKRVLVVGIGNSGADIACDAATVAAATFLSTRRGAHVMPKHLWGRPIDRWGSGLISYLSPRVQGWAVAAALRLARGPLSSYGLPQPSHRIDQAHPTLSPELLRFLRDGRVRVRPDIRELDGDRVIFADASREAIDVVVTATGYDVCYPFLEGCGIDLEALHLQVIPPQHPGLYFIGHVQPFQGPVLRAAWAQARWAAALITGAAARPDPGRMAEQIRRQREWRESSLVRTARHALEVNFYEYVRAVEAEMKRRPESR